jgi:amino acid transporter
MAVANAAPITAMTGNVPIAVGSGNGLGAPAGFLVATVVLTLFTVGFVAMARHITTAGGFYGFISHGLGQVWGMAAGVLATLAYVVFEGSLIGIFSYFASYTLEQWFGWQVNWLVLAGVGILAVACWATSTSAWPPSCSASSSSRRSCCSGRWRSPSSSRAAAPAGSCGPRSTH